MTMLEDVLEITESEMSSKHRKRPLKFEGFH